MLLLWTYHQFPLELEPGSQLTLTLSPSHNPFSSLFPPAHVTGCSSQLSASASSGFILRGMPLLYLYEQCLHNAHLITLTTSCLPTSSDRLCCVISAASKISNFAFILKRNLHTVIFFFSDVWFYDFCTCMNSRNDHYGQDTQQFQYSKESLCSPFIFRLLPPLAPGNQWSVLCSYIFCLFQNVI